MKELQISYIYEFLLFDLELQTEDKIILLLILRVYKNAKAI